MNATVDYYPDECDEVTNILNVTGIPYNGDNVTNNTWVNVTVCEANISVLKIDQTFAIASQGGLVTYNLTITNNGNVTLDPVRVVDTLPSQLEYTATNMTPNSTTGDVVIWENISSLAPGESVKITLNATVKSLSGMGCINISNNLTAEGVPPNGDNVSHTDLLDVEVCEAGIEVTKTVNHASIYTGNSAVFAITVQNNGFVNLSNVTLTDVLPSGLTYQSTNVTPNSTAPYVWYIGNLSVGSAAVKISITVKGPSRGTFTNYVNATASVPNGDNVSDEATRSLTVKKRSSGGGSGGSSGSMIIYNPTLPSEICGNGKCTGNETCMNCPEDCGECVVTIVVEKIPGLGEEIVIIVLGDDGIEVSEGIVFFTGPDGAVREVDIIGGIAKAVMDAPGVWTISYTDAAGNKVVETVAIARLSPEIKPDTTKDEAKDSYEPFVPTEYTSKEQTSSEDNTLLIVAVIVVIVAVIAALAFFMKPKKKGVLGSFLPKKVKKTGLRSL